MIKPEAGIKNPPKAGQYAIGLLTSRSLSTSYSFYNISASSVSQAQVLVSPAIAGVNAKYNINFLSGPQGGLTGGQDSITVSFPTDTFIPQFINATSITVNGYPAPNGTVVKSGSSITFKLPQQVTVNALNQVNITISESAGILNGQSGTYTLDLRTSKEPLSIQSKTYIIEEGSISVPKVQVNPPVPGVTAEYIISFNVSAFGFLTGGTDTISINFPHEITIPSTISRNAITINGWPLDTGTVTLSGKTLTFKVPSNASVESGGTVVVNIKTNSGIKNPVQSGFYKLSISTSKDNKNVLSDNYTIEKKTIVLVINSKTAFIDNQPVLLDVPALILNGRTLVPIRFVAESLGAEVGWNSNTREVTVKLDGKIIKLTIDSNIAMVDGIPQILDTMPIIKDSRTLVPIRFLAENFGSAVTWNSSTQTVSIEK